MPVSEKLLLDQVNIGSCGSAVVLTCAEINFKSSAAIEDEGVANNLAVQGLEITGAVGRNIGMRREERACNIYTGPTVEDETGGVGPRHIKRQAGIWIACGRSLQVDRRAAVPSHSTAGQIEEGVAGSQSISHR